MSEPQSIYIVQRRVTWRGKSESVEPFACFSADQAKEECRKRHDHSAKWCDFCSAEWDGMTLSYDNDGAGVCYQISELPLLTPKEPS